MQKNKINPSLLQELLDSAPNAAAKGQAQYFTPDDWAKVLAWPLPQYRPTITDLNCGAANLLLAARNRSTEAFLACDIDGAHVPAHDKLRFVQADINQLYPLLKDARFGSSLFVLNPPWDLHWYRLPLERLLTSFVPAVSVAFAAHDGHTPLNTIDSTVATLCLAMDLASSYGEGYLIGNEATLQRLILRPDAPHGALAQHVWAHLIIDGNICLPSQRPSQPSTLNPQPSFQTGVIYWSLQHSRGLKGYRTADKTEYHCADIAAARSACRSLADNRDYMHRGAELRDYIESPIPSHEQRWLSAIEEFHRLDAAHPLHKPQWNIWLTPDGTIQTALSLFDSASSRYTTQQAATLHQLNDKLPLQLVMQRAHRKVLEEAAGPNSPWRVDPSLSAAVSKAVSDYNTIRAPLKPLPTIQRLGYLDEHDTIDCAVPLGFDISGAPLFISGQSYPIRSTTVRVQRKATKVNLSGGLDDVEYDGQELAFWIADKTGAERCFMEARLRDPSVKVFVAAPYAREAIRKLKAHDLQPCAIDFTLQELAEHFAIPDVPDVATLHPDQYLANLKLLDEIESLCTQV